MTAPKDSDAKETKKADLSVQQSMATLGIGLIAMGEDIGAQMAMRSFAHLFRYGVKWRLIVMEILFIMQASHVLSAQFRWAWR